MNKKGFTLIELLAVIVIIAVIGLIAIPSISKTIDNSRKKAYIEIANAYVDAVRNKIASRQYTIKTNGTSYYIPIDIIEIEGGPKQSPYGEWAVSSGDINYIAFDDDDVGNCSNSGTKPHTTSSSDPYKIYNTKYNMFESEKTYTKVNNGCIKNDEMSDAYVIVVYNLQKKKYDYYWASRDDSKHKINPTKIEDLTVDNILMSDIPVGTFKEVDKYAVTISNSDNPTSGFKYITNEFSARTVGISTKVQMYFPDKDLGVSSYSYDLSASEARACFIFNYKEDGSISIIEYVKTCPTDVVIPSSIDGKTVTEIGIDAFNGKTAFGNNRFVTSVIIPDTVTKIGSRAFYYNAITSLVLPNTSIEIGEQAFADNYLTEINVTPNTTLSGSPFTNNKVPEDKAFIYSTRADGTKDYTFLVGYAGTNKNIVIPDGVITVGHSAFRGYKLDSLVIADSVQEIQTWGFASTGIKTVTLPSNLKKIGYGAFASNGLTSLVIPDSVSSIGNRAFNGNIIPDNPSTGHGPFIYARKSNGSGGYMDDTTTIVSYAGSNKEISIPNGVKTINSAAFFSCGLKKITIPSSVTSIGSKAFNNNIVPDANGPFIYSLTNSNVIIGYAGSNKYPKIPNNITTINASAFDEAGIKGVTFCYESGKECSLKTIGTSAFRNAYITGTITIPSSVTTIGDNAFCKEVSWGVFNRYDKIVNKTNKGFNWKKITCSINNTISDATGTISHHLGDIELTNS